MDTNELAGLLPYSLDRGINHWDTAFQYNTCPHIKEALKLVRRTDIGLTTKFSAAHEKETIRGFNTTLKDLNVDYVDALYEDKTELQMRSSVLHAMVKLKKEGKVRAIGLSFHGQSTLKSVLEIPKLHS